tara:strand:- start:606 stop:1106 length:501 start_codon:yes stop_codon:yes gene_type:complete
MKTKDMESKDEALMAIVNSKFKLDINKRSRVRAYVEARLVFCRILKEEGYGSYRLGKILKLNHSSVNNYWSKADLYISSDEILRKKYLSIRQTFYKDKDPIYSEIKNELEMLSMDNKVLSLRNAHLEDAISRSTEEDSLYGDMFAMIKERTPNQQQLKRFLNGLHV